MINDFKSLFNRSPSLIKNNIVVGLSGGPDSIFLLYYINYLKEQFSYMGSVIPIIVDHGLRIESNTEALKTKKIATKIGYSSTIVKIKDKYSSGNLQNWARIKRRNILYNIAQRHSADIVLGHQYDDQIETIYMRLIRSSGFNGLAGINEITKWKEITILRPLLKIKKIEILNFLESKKIPFVIDNSNFDTKFQRVKSRKYLKLLKENKFCNIENQLHKLSNISKRFTKCINEYKNLWKNRNAVYYSHGSISINYKSFKLIFKKNELFSSYIFGKLIKNVGGNDFSPRKLKLINNLRNFFNGKFNKFTTNNVLIWKKLNSINLIRENRNIKYGLEIKKNKFFFFDNRFLVLSNFNGNLISNDYNSNFINDFCNNESMSEFNKYINCTIPNLKTLEGKVIKPYLYIMDNKKINNKLKLKTDFDLIFIKDKN